MQGARGLAAELSRKGRGHDMRMRELHRNAAEQIFRRRNSAGRSAGNVIDLHGLHVQARTC